MIKKEKRLLLVEDDKDWADMLTNCLDGEGFEVVVALTVELALRELQKGPSPDLMILDHLVGLSYGLNILAYLNAMHVAIPTVVACGSDLDGAMRAEYAVYGVREFLRKPYEIPDLLIAIRNL